MASSTQPWRSTRPLSEASTQEIQLELVRRHRFNHFDGERVVESLLRHRGSWSAVLMDRVSVPLIKLRDLPDGHWNVDELFILCQTRADAQAMAQLAIDDDWQADRIVPYVEARVVSELLGSPDEVYVVSFWWD